MTPKERGPCNWVDGCQFANSGFQCDSGHYWSAESLYKAAHDQGCKPYKLPIKHMDLTTERGGLWAGNRVIDVAEICRRVMDTDLSNPILLGPLGNVMDGFHRWAKAVALGHSHILAIRLKELPPPTETSREQ